MQCEDLPGALSADGRNRLQCILGPIRKARDKRDRLGLRAWIEQTWIELGGLQCARDGSGLQDAENFLQLLELAEVEGRGLDIEWLSRSLQTRYMNTGNHDSKVQLMTLHKAKGLEFDCVIIPQLDRVTAKDSRDLLLWDEHNNTEGTRSFLLAADDHSARDTPTLYNYLLTQRQHKSQQESARLLYVGTTRAVSRLVLTCKLKSAGKSGQPANPSRNSLLNPIWQTFQQEMTIHESVSVPEAATTPATVPLLTRLVRDGPGPVTIAPVERSPSKQQVLKPRPDNYLERSIGTVVHLALEQLSLRPTLPAAVLEEDRERWRMALQREGLWGETLDEALEAVLSSIRQTLRPDGKGRWILSGEHEQARSEWSLSTVDSDGRIHDIVIDRCFIDRVTGERWVIDYKNSRPGPGELLEDFFSRECASYQEQLLCYRDVLSFRCSEPLRCALFFTSLGQLYPMP